MDGSDRVEERTFRVSFSSDGAAKLRERVREKLKEFMGDYTDDTLVEYVIVLLRNGRRMEEAKNELNVFLGDDTDSFVSWLWNHLSSNLNLYVQDRESYPAEVAIMKSQVEQQVGQFDSAQLDSDFEREKSAKELKSRRNREWKGLVRDAAEPPPLRSSEVEIIHSEEKIRHKSGRPKRSRSPRSPIRKKRSHQDSMQHAKRELPSHPTVDAPRRLLQFAVRDAVGTSRPSNSRVEPALKRLRSVVSTSTGDLSHDDQSHRIRSSKAQLPSAVAIAVKAASEAAEDVAKARYPGNVFDRLGRSIDASGLTNQSFEYKGNDMENEDYEDFDQMAGESCNFVPRNEYGRQFARKSPMLNENNRLSYDSASDNDGYDDVDVINHRSLDTSQADASCANKDEGSLMVQYSVAKNTNEVVRRNRVKEQNPSSAVGNRKIVNISVNVNTWKPPPHYQASQDIQDRENLITVEGNEATVSKPLKLMSDRRNATVTNKENDKSGKDAQNESQKSGSFSTVRPLEDADSRTIFVSNVHFAATKDTLSRHFNKFGDVLKVIIVTDAASGQPTGSAYVEFTSKEAAEHALSLNGTSFMSRILKVVMKSSAYQEATNITSWPRVARPSPYAARLARVPFPRGIPGAFRGRLPIMQGARSLQWKRETQNPATDSTSVNAQTAAPFSSSSAPSPTARHLTYVRKPEGNTGPA